MFSPPESDVFGSIRADQVCPVTAIGCVVLLLWRGIGVQPLETLLLCAVAELRADVALPPDGQGRAGLHEESEKRVLLLFTGRVLPFDLSCTQACIDAKNSCRRNEPLWPSLTRKLSGCAAEQRA